jgi:hypothetical protein
MGPAQCLCATTELVFARRSAAMLGIALLAAGLSGITLRDAQAKPPGYNFTKIATLGDPAPGGPPSGGIFVNDFEPGGLNSQGDMAFGADVSTGGEGVFLRPHNRQITGLGRSNGPAPGGGSFDEHGFLGPMGLNDQGDAVFDFLLKDFMLPFGVNAGSYRYSHTTGKVTQVVIPSMTPAPGFESTFQGVFYQPTINNRGDVVFAGIVKTAQGVHVVPPDGKPYIGLGIGIFQADAKGHIAEVIVPGDAAPGGGKFDYAVEPWVNDGGDVSFIGHIAGEESVVAGFPPQADFISALGGLYVKQGGTGKIRTIVHEGDPAPGGGNFRQVFHDVMNSRGDIAFGGDLTPAPDVNQSIGAFVYSSGKITAVARPGDPMPGGGKLVNASIVGGNVHVNNRGDVAFSGVVDTDVDHDGNDDTGLFQWSDGDLSLIARTGTVIPGVGTVFALASVVIVVPPSPINTTTSGAINNDAGQVLFCATLIDGHVVLLLATPRP